MRERDFFYKENTVIYNLNISYTNCICYVTLTCIQLSEIFYQNGIILHTQICLLTIIYVLHIKLDKLIARITSSQQTCRILQIIFNDFCSIPVIRLSIQTMNIGFKTGIVVYQFHKALTKLRTGRLLSVIISPGRTKGTHGGYGRIILALIFPTKSSMKHSSVSPRSSARKAC